MVLSLYRGAVESAFYVLLSLVQLGHLGNKIAFEIEDFVENEFRVCWCLVYFRK
jgi:hypothetical protein